MSRAASTGFILLSRRAYTSAAAAAAESTGVASTVRNVVDSDMVNMGNPVKGVKKEVFWMRDSKTGNWLPETHFDEIDVVELRAKFLPKNKW